MRWEGLYQVCKVDNDNVYWVVEISLDTEVTNEPFEVHAQRMRFYEDKYYEVTETVLEQFLLDRNHYEVSALIDLRLEHELEFQVRWRGFTEEYDTWEPALNLIADVPTMVEKFVRANLHHSLTPFALRLLEDPHSS